MPMIRIGSPELRNTLASAAYNTFPLQIHGLYKSHLFELDSDQPQSNANLKTVSHASSLHLRKYEYILLDQGLMLSYSRADILYCLVLSFQMYR